MSNVVVGDVLLGGCSSPKFDNTRHNKCTRSPRMIRHINICHKTESNTPCKHWRPCTRNAIWIPGEGPKEDYSAPNKSQVDVFIAPFRSTPLIIVGIQFQAALYLSLSLDFVFQFQGVKKIPSLTLRNL